MLMLIIQIRYADHGAHTYRLNSTLTKKHLVLKAFSRKIQCKASRNL